MRMSAANRRRPLVKTSFDKPIRWCSGQDISATAFSTAEEVKMAFKLARGRKYRRDSEQTMLSSTWLRNSSTTGLLDVVDGNDIALTGSISIRIGMYYIS